MNTISLTARVDGKVIPRTMVTIRPGEISDADRDKLENAGVLVITVKADPPDRYQRFKNYVSRAILSAPDWDMGISEAVRRFEEI